jgi:putative DNA primase/helicase
MCDPRQAFRAAMLNRLGHAPEVIEPGKLHRFATSEKRGDDAGWCKLFADERGGVFGCNRSGISETWCAFDRAAMTRPQRAELARQIEAATRERERMQQQQWALNAQHIEQTWSECVPLTPGDPVTLYLKRRGFAGVWPLPSCLRLHRAMPYWVDGQKTGVFVTMVAPLVAPSGRIVALHRTYLTADGRKADVPSPKKLTATAGPLGGACIPLHAPTAGVIGIAEGIETALAAWLASAVPTVAAYCAGNLAAWMWPQGAQRIVIFGDNDHAGREAVDKLRTRALAAGLRCDLHMPSDDGTDWCDVWATRGVIEEVMA